MNRIYYIPFILLFFLSLLSCHRDLPCKEEDNFFLKGADVSFLPDLRSSGFELRNENNQVEDILLTLKRAGVNTIRLRLWKNPDENNSDFETIKELASEIKLLGFKLMLTVHYSDTWADPGHQAKPSDWEGISFEQMKDSLYHYTKSIVEEIKPHYIQIGNEINNGLLWPDGHISNSHQMIELLDVAISASRKTNRHTKVILHFAGHYGAEHFFSNLFSLDYDLIGLSYYPFWHGKDLDSLKQSMISVSSTTNKPVLIVETSYPFTFDWNDWTHNVIGDSSQILPQFTATPQGQYDFLYEIKQIVKDVPTGAGFCYWGAEWVSFKGNTSTEGSPWENQAFWDFSNKVLPVIGCFGE